LREQRCYKRGGSRTSEGAISIAPVAATNFSSASLQDPTLQGLSGPNSASIGRITLNRQSHLCAGFQCRGFASANSGANEGGTGSGSEQSESDRRFDQSGEYDTQERYKRVGNPISWANPTGGGTAEDTSSKHWRWIFPAGVSLILVGCLWSRRKAMRKEHEEALMQAPDINVPDMRGFSTPPPAPPPPMPPPGYEPAYPAPGYPAAAEPAYPAPDSETSGGGFSFSPPPQAGSRSGW